MKFNNILVEKESVKVLVITGSGEKAFVAGADISEFSNYSVDEGGALAKKGQEMLFDFIENLSKPVIAAVNGFALGGGLELAIMTAGMISAEEAKVCGLVNHVVPLEALLPLAEKLANKIMRNSSVAMGAAIRAVNANFEDGVNGYEVEIAEFGKKTSQLRVAIPNRWFGELTTKLYKEFMSLFASLYSTQMLKHVP